MEREGEHIAGRPGRLIAVCGEGVFTGDSGAEAVSKAQAAHPGRPIFLRKRYPELGERGEHGDEEGNVRVEVDPAFEGDVSRQRELYGGREGELLARRRGKVIGICAGEVFVGYNGSEAISRAEAVYPDRAIFVPGMGEFCGGL